MMQLSTTEVAKMVSQAWKALPETEREKWEEMARQDKARYEMEKSMYTGPWKVPATKRSKDPKAPRRPMSAFLSFSNSKRTFVKKKYKDANNAEVSRVLAQMWKDADAEEKKAFVDEEFRLRQQYKIAMMEWKRQSAEEIKTKREERENEAMKFVREGKLPLRREDIPSSRNGLCSTADSNSSVGLKYSTKMASDTFAPSQANSHHASHSGKSSSSANHPVAPAYSFSDEEYRQQYPQPSPHYLDQQASTTAIYTNSNTYGNPYETSPYRVSTGHPNTYGNFYDRRYEGGNGMGRDSYGQPNQYGYAPTAYYYHQGTEYSPSTNSSSEHTHQHQHQQNFAGYTPFYHQYDPNQTSDQNYS